MYEIKLSKDSEKFLKKCHSIMKEDLKKQLRVLQNVPRKQGSSLVGEFKGYYRIELFHNRVEYRAIYEVDDIDMIVFVLLIDKRGQVYERGKGKKFAKH